MIHSTVEAHQRLELLTERDKGDFLKSLIPTNWNLTPMWKEHRKEVTLQLFEETNQTKDARTMNKDTSRITMTKIIIEDDTEDNIEADQIIVEDHVASQILAEVTVVIGEELQAEAIQTKTMTEDMKTT